MPEARERFTWVVVHAHPDDEALLTAGSMAKAAAEGHRVVLVVATDGGAGLAAAAAVAEGRTLAEVRLRELEESARRLGVARVVHLGFGDSGLDGLGAGLPAGVAPFAQVTVDEAAARIASVLDEERADAVSVYDAAGGYGHPDHLQVHRAGSAAAALAGTTSGARGHRPPRPTAPGHPAGVAGLPLPTRVRSDRLWARVQLPPRRSPTASTSVLSWPPSAPRWPPTPPSPRPTRVTARSRRSSACRARCTDGSFAPSGTSSPGARPVAAMTCLRPSAGTSESGR